MANFSFDFDEIIVRLCKYGLEGLVVGVCAWLLPANHKLPVSNVILIALVAAATFSLLDMLAPSLAQHARTGAGFSLGAAAVGGIPTRGL